MKYSRRFQIEPLCSLESAWIGCPGFVPELSGSLICLAYSVGNEAWSIGIAFHSKRCAEAALRIVERMNLTPRRYHSMSADESAKVKREILVNLLW